MMSGNVFWQRVYYRQVCCAREAQHFQECCGNSVIAQVHKHVRPSAPLPQINTVHCQHLEAFVVSCEQHSLETSNWALFYLL